MKDKNPSYEDRLKAAQAAIAKVRVEINAERMKDGLKPVCSRIPIFQVGAMTS